MGRKTRRIYTDTSVIGGCLDEEFEDASTQLTQRFAGGEDILVLSDLTRAELRRAPDDVRAVLRDIPPDNIEEVELTEEAADLAEQYVGAGVIGATNRLDAQHIATATVHQVDVLVSWNFRHIVNLDRIRGYNSVNLRLGYSIVEIRSPREVLPYGE
jgi:predicted nucleic acid-binding protein